jgi:hypothetical protein
MAHEWSATPSLRAYAQYLLLGSLFGMERSRLRPSQRQLADHLGLEPLYVSKLARTLRRRWSVPCGEPETEVPANNYASKNRPSKSKRGRRDTLTLVAGGHRAGRLRSSRRRPSPTDAGESLD